MARFGGFELSRVAEALRRELPDRLQHPEPLVCVPHEALLDQRLERVEAHCGHPLGCLERTAALKDSELREDPLFLGIQQVVRPLDRRPQRLLARVCVAASLEEIEPLREPVENLRGREHAAARGRELERQRQVVEGLAELRHGRVLLDGGARAEELDCVPVGQRLDRILDLAAHAQELAARNEQPQVRACLDERGQLRRRVDDLLEVVEHEQELALADVVRERALRADRPADRVGDERRISDRGQADPEDSGHEVWDELAGRLDRQTRLAGAARAREGEQARSVP